MSIHKEKNIPISHLEVDWLNWIAGWLRLDPALAESKKNLAVGMLEGIVAKFDLWDEEAQ